MSSGLPPATAWDANNLAARYDRYRIDLAKISEAPVKSLTSELQATPYAASSCLDIILAMRPFAMDNARWHRYIDEHHEMDLAATRGSRNRHGEVRTPKGVVPVAPLLGETALEYAAVWFLKLANDPNQVQNKLRDYTHVLEDLANYAKSRHRGPRLHFYVVRWLLAVRSHRYSEVADLV
ncbi:hypothetical protein Ae201684P_019160 [Aphanomyces euteiches]|nr:hypothetical protein Ae201684P_019160 [Aphanomyces euteiches]